MLKLTALCHQHLTENTIKTLALNRIVTVLDFLMEDAEKLAIITKLNIAQIVELRSDIYSKYAAPFYSGSDLLVKFQNINAFVSTGVESLDSIMEGGIPIGYITEICGLAGSGKSQLCMQIAVNHAKNTDTTVLYIDTKGDFSAVRIQRMLDSAGFTLKDIAATMLRIKIVYIWNMEDLIELIKVLKNGILEKLSIIIIDSLPCLMFQHFGDNSKIGFSYLNTLVIHLKHLCGQMHICVMCVNLQTRWINLETASADGEAEPGNIDSNYQETRIRCLGKYWQHIPYLEINLEKLHAAVCEDSNSFHCTITVYKCNIPQIYRNCQIKIGLAGIS